MNEPESSRPAQSSVNPTPSHPSPMEVRPVNPKPHWGMDEGTFCLLLHLSQLSGFIIPGAGLVLPIVMWATEHENSSVIDRQGKIIFNWMISSLIYILVSIILLFFLVGVFTLIIVGIMALCFPIIGAVKASKGETWKYPLSIPFFST